MRRFISVPIRLGSLVAALLLTGVASAAVADVDVELQQQLVVGGEVLTPGESIVAPEEAIAEQCEDSAAGESEVAASDRAELADELIDSADEEGLYADPLSIDYVSLFDGEVQMAVPVSTDIDSVRLTLTKDSQLSVSVEASSGEGAPVSTGPGMAYWAGNGLGQYVLKIDGLVDSRFTWSRYKLMDDGDPYRITYGYKRWGDAQPHAINNFPDPRVRTLRIQSFPFDSIEPGLAGWVENGYSPASDQSTGSCDASSVGFSYMGVSLSRNVEKCGRYNMWRNVDKAASYWIQYEGDGDGGNREVAFVMAWKMKNGYSGSLHDLNQVVVDFPYWTGQRAISCTQTDANRTCES